MGFLLSDSVSLLAARSPGFDPAQMLLPAVVVGVLTVVMISTRNRIRRSRSEPRASAAERYADLQRERGAARDLETVMAELDQLSRQIHGRLDAKLARIEALIRDADQRIERLTRLQRASAGEPTLDVTLDPEPPRTVTTERTTNAESNPHDEVHRLADSGLSPVEIAGQLGRHTGEIELILSLRRARGAPGYTSESVRQPQPAGR